MPSGVTWYTYIVFDDHARFIVLRVDFVVAEYMTTVKHFEPQILDKYPAISKFIRKVQVNIRKKELYCAKMLNFTTFQTLPQIFDYISNREHQPVH